jgi:tryptophan synthase alpha chain
MSRLSTRFAQLKQSGRKALIPFVTVGDPNPEFTLPLLHAMVAAGADILELGIPFSDPMADGPVIQRASERALVHKMSLRKVLAIAAEFRKTDQQTPLVLMGYVNPIEIMGYQTFADVAQQAEIDGVLTVDLPPEEAEECSALLTAKGIDPIFLLAPNSSVQRIEKIALAGRGYLYYVSLKGVTGAGHLDSDAVKNKLAQIRHYTDLPIAVGFGVKDAQTAKTIADLSDAVVVGSALIGKIEAHVNDLTEAQTQIVALLTAMRSAIDSQ